MIRYTPFLLIFLFVFNVTKAQTFDLINGDTINLTDANNLKQGHWIIYNKTKNLPGYKPDQIVEEGNYVGNKKTGIWKTYHSNGRVQQEITFVNGIANGLAKLYYESGVLREEGMWKINKWVGGYKFYFENGNKAYDFNYNQLGKREGEQKYFHENGKIMIEGSWVNGNESGTLKEYYEDGTLKLEKHFVDGKCNHQDTKEFNANGAVKPKETQKVEETPVVKETPKPTETDGKVEVFGETGNFSFKNRFGKVSKEGYFVNGRLFDGKEYTYDSDGDLSKTSIYKNGKIVQEIEK